MERMRNDYGTPGGRFDAPARPGGGGSPQGRPWLRPVRPDVPVMRPAVEPSNVNRPPMMVPVPFGAPEVVGGYWAYPADEWVLQGTPAWRYGAGWSKCANPDCADVWGEPGFGIWGSGSTCAAIAHCPVGQSGGVWNTTRRFWEDPHPTRLVVLGYVWTSGNYTDATFRGTVVTQFVRSSASVTAMPQFGQVAAPLPAWPLPWSLPAGFADVGTKVSLVPSPAVLPRVSPRLDPDGRVKARPYVRPAWETAFPAVSLPRPAVRPLPRRVPHMDVPDDAVKPRRVPPALLAAIKLMHDTTEVGDLVDAVYDSLSQYRKRRCGRPKGIGGRFACIASNWDAFTTDPGAADNIQRALNNALENNVGDRALGKLFGAKWKGLGPDRGTGIGATNPPPTWMSPMV